MTRSSGVSEVRTVETSLGVLTLRPERPDDAAFLSRLFAETHSDLFRHAGLPEPMIAGLMTMQHRAQTASYRAAFPDARSLVAEHGHDLVGRLVVRHEANLVHVVDIAVLPAFHRRGIGTALVRAACGDGAARAHVALDNAPSLALFRRLGFAPAADDGVYVALHRPHP